MDLMQLSYGEEWKALLEFHLDSTGGPTAVKRQFVRALGLGLLEAADTATILEAPILTQSFYNREESLINPQGLLVIETLSQQIHLTGVTKHRKHSSKFS